MSAVIARASRDFTMTGKFSGVYHYSNNDYEPDCLGQTLYQIFQGTAAPAFFPYARDVESILWYLIDDHPNGWQSINVKPKCDCAAERAARRIPEARARCYCVLEPKVAIAQQYASAEATERNFREATFAYVLDPVTTMMYVFSGVTRGGRRIDCGLARGQVPVGWTWCDSVNLSEEEPDWKSITYGYPEMRLYRSYEKVYGVDIAPNSSQLAHAACCPEGHSFLRATGYRPGDRCQGANPHFVGQHGRPTASQLRPRPEDAEPCSHVFQLPKDGVF